MRCIFCKKDSSSSRSVEHIIPESLWNTKHILPKGIVCDSCNNYFAREVEKPFLDSQAISLLRFQQAIPNKRGRIPEARGVMLPGFEVIARRPRKDPYGMTLEVPPDALAYFNTQVHGRIVFPAPGDPPDARIVSRFLAKMALEAMAMRVRSEMDGLDYLVEEAQLDALRNFARRGTPKSWPCSIRRIYSADRILVETDGSWSQTVHEFDFLVTATNEWYFVFALFGLEFAINLGGPEIDGYLAWIKENGSASPLYSGKNGISTSL
jgi:hypothetical protein